MLRNDMVAITECVHPSGIKSFIMLILKKMTSSSERALDFLDWDILM